MKKLPLLLLPLALLAVAATTYTITQLTANNSPSAGTVIEVYDPLASPKSGKYTLANKQDAITSSTDLTARSLTMGTTNVTGAIAGKQDLLGSTSTLSISNLNVYGTANVAILDSPELIVSNMTANSWVYVGADKVLTNAPYTPANKAGDTFTGTVGFSGTSTLLNLPSLTTAQKNAASAVAGSQAYDSDLGRVQMYDGSAWHSRVRLDGDFGTTGANLYFPYFSAGQYQNYWDTLTHAGSMAIDWSGTNAHTMSLTGNVTFTFSNIASNRTFRLKLYGNTSSNSTITWPANIHGGPATFSTANKTMLVSGTTDGSNATNCTVVTFEDP